MASSQTQQQQQTGQQQLDAAFPAPPDYFHHFTNPSQTTDNPYLTPPPPLTTGEYSMFGRTWKVHEQLPTLSEQSATQLYPEGEIDRVVELQKLNHSAVFEFLEMVDILIKDPSQFGERSASIHNIFVNMHHLINEYRGNQAVETLKVLMGQQIEGKREAARSVREKCDELDKMIEKLKQDARDKGGELKVVEKEQGASDAQVVERPEKDVEADGLRNLIDAISNIQ
ncbi:Mediator of RNA polymerase II transcription subunit 7 [Linderina macrospora]|uniref:Mediator of RNA polymerase II transcription subunit 7 n=1 Tax=Linderina macrospora TaxID=4868 RepID=A0ACC1JEM7_9FUNG|nr:Mediator of RNA polymerase II transcription subunit 7 [Linderina macrospora]